MKKTVKKGDVTFVVTSQAQLEGFLKSGFVEVEQKETKKQSNK